MRRKSSSIRNTDKCKAGVGASCAVEARPRRGETGARERAQSGRGRAVVRLGGAGGHGRGHAAARRATKREGTHGLTDFCAGEQPRAQRARGCRAGDFPRRLQRPASTAAAVRLARNRWKLRGREFVSCDSARFWEGGLRWRGSSWGVW